MYILQTYNGSAYTLFWSQTFQTHFFIYLIHLFIISAYQTQKFMWIILIQKYNPTYLMIINYLINRKFFTNHHKTLCDYFFVTTPITKTTNTVCETTNQSISVRSMTKRQKYVNDWNIYNFYSDYSYTYYEQ